MYFKTAYWFSVKIIDKNGAHSNILHKKKKYILTTNQNKTNKNYYSNVDLKIVNTANSMKIVCGIQTKVVEATQDIQVTFAASDAPTEEVADLVDKTTNELEKHQWLKWVPKKKL